MLQRLAVQEPNTSSQLSVKVRAMDDLARDDGPIPVEYFRQNLIWAVGDPFGDYLGQRTASLASRLLDYIDSALEQEPDVEPHNPFFDLDLVSDLARGRGMRITSTEWRSGSERIERLDAEADVILAADDPPAALAAWREANGISTLPQVSDEDDDAVFVTDDGDLLLDPPDPETWRSPRPGPTPG
jgi:hypothetical protein